MKGSKILGDRLQELRKDKGMPQFKLAQILGVATSSVGKWERGEIYPRIDNMLLITEEFGVSMDYFFKIRKNTTEKEVGKWFNRCIKEGKSEEEVINQFQKMVIYKSKSIDDFMYRSAITKEEFEDL